MMRCFFR